MCSVFPGEPHHCGRSPRGAPQAGKKRKREEAAAAAAAEAEEDVDDEAAAMNAMMGFGSFGGSKKGR